MDCTAKVQDVLSCPSHADTPLIHLVQDQDAGKKHPANNATKPAAARATDAEVKAGNLPSITIDMHHGAASDTTRLAHPAPVAADTTRVAHPMPIAPGAHAAEAKPATAEHHWYTGTLAVVEDIGIGAYKEVTQHPLHVAESFAIGAVTAAVASAVSAPVAVALTIGAVGVGAYEIAKHAPGWIKAAEELHHPEHFSQKEVAKAHETWQNFGGGATDLAAGIAGGVAYRAASSAITQAMEEAAEAHPVKTAAASSTTNDGGTSAQAAGTTTGDGGASSHATGAATPGDGGASSHAAAATTPGDGGASSHAASGVAGTQPDGGSALHGATVPTDGGTSAHAGHAAIAGAGAGAGADHAADAAAAAMTPEEAMAASVRSSQGVFEQAGQEGGKGVIESVKQLYNVRFERVTEEAGRRIFTLENPTEGVVVPKGAFIATRLDAAGQPVIENGIQNSWSIQGAKLLKTYNVEPETVNGAAQSFIAPTRIDGPSVHMVQLQKPTEIITGWGSMKGKIGDWLANYDFNKGTGSAGKDFAIVTDVSYKQTYQPKM